MLAASIIGCWLTSIKTALGLSRSKMRNRQHCGLHQGFSDLVLSRKKSDDENSQRDGSRQDKKQRSGTHIAKFRVRQNYHW